MATTSAKKKQAKKATTKPMKKKASAKAAKRPVRAAAKGEIYGGISSAAVEKATGKGWPEWFRILDRAGAAKMAHTDIATHLYDKCGVPGWWCQMVTVGYEQARGLRIPHQTAAGFSASISRTISAPLAALFAACDNPSQRARWLGEAPIEFRTSTKNKSARWRWTGSSPKPAKGAHSAIAINFLDKTTAGGPAKSQIQLQHEPLASDADVRKAKKFWSDRLETLRSILE